MAENRVSFNLIRQEADAVFIYKKIEQISTAVYMVANLMADGELLKTELKKISLSLLKTSSTLAKGESVLGVFASVRGDLSFLLSLLDVSSSARMMSSMNYTILKAEIENLAMKIEESEKEYGSNSPFSSIFHAVAVGTSTKTEVNSTNTAHDDKGQVVAKKDITQKQDTFVSSNNIQNNSQVEQNRQVINRTKVQTPQTVTNEMADHFPVRSGTDLRKENRKNIILNAIFKKGVVTIKDVSAVVRDCSEKTIQRELLAMVSEGLLKKEGDRRWSTYSLNSKS